MTTNQDSQTEPGARAGVIKLGLDVHASSIVVVRQIDAQVPQPAQHYSPEQFLGFARKQVARAERSKRGHSLTLDKHRLLG